MLVPRMRLELMLDNGPAPPIGIGEGVQAVQEGR